MTGNALADDGKAIVDKFAAIASIATLVPGGLHEGPLDPPAAQPYATYTVKQGPRPNEYTSSGDWINYSEVTITLFGIGAKAVGDVAGSVQAGIETGSLTISNADWMRTERLPGEINEAVTTPGDGTKSGEEYRRCLWRYCIWSHRRA
jgi:hypothetical protein